MKTLLRHVMAVATVAAFGLVAAPQAQADNATVNDFTNGTNLVDSVNGLTFTAVGDSSSPNSAIFQGWNVQSVLTSAFNPTLQTPPAFSGTYNIDVGGALIVGQPDNYTLAYTVSFTGDSSSDGFRDYFSRVSYNINLLDADRIQVTKEVYDFKGGTLLGTLGPNDSVEIFNLKLKSLYIVDTLNYDDPLLASTFSSFTNNFRVAEAVPEPMTILGASAAVAFGSAFKRRKKQG